MINLHSGPDLIGSGVRNVGGSPAGLGCRGHGGGEGAVELAGDVPLEAAADLPRVLALGGAPGDVGLGARAAAHPGRGDGVQGPVHGAVPAPVEPVPHGAAAAGGSGLAPPMAANAAS